MFRNQNALACEEAPSQGFLGFNSKQHLSTAITTATGDSEPELTTPFATVFLAASKDRNLNLF